ncbi:uncharacterized protein LOC107640472 [Arachis ipaensis]|uniref:uncharacterized protein LOC107640472 n=1 Tax=Arachis ipaensis TaxID=130454 RepID=UPI0007AF3DA3|nr:uncharacterized protein LOC107640472 [Arachis ipaensis]
MHGVKFTDKEPLNVLTRSTDTLSDLKRNILQKAGLCGAKLVKKVFYKILMAVVSSGMQYETFVIGSDEDMEFRGFSAKSSVDDSGGTSTSMPVVAPGCLLAAHSLVLAPTARSLGLIIGLVGGGEPDHVEDAIQKDDSNDEPDHISRDSEEETSVAPLAPQGPSSSGSHQQPPHFSTLNLEAIIWRCKEFGNGCTWMIRVALRQHKDNWEVRRYNGAYTCLATSISRDHRQFDYHVTCARIYLLVRADAAVTIKVLQEATESTYGFRPSYRKMWKAKQKAVAQIYGDWEELYTELPR